MFYYSLKRLKLGASYRKSPKSIVVFFDLSSPFFNRVDKFLTLSMEPGEWFITLSQTDKTTNVKLTITLAIATPNGTDYSNRCNV